MWGWYIYSLVNILRDYTILVLNAAFELAAAADQYIKLL